MNMNHICGWSRRGPATRTGGFSMVELMVAMTISLLLMAALVTLLSNNSRATTELDRSSRQIENGRFAVDTLSRQIQMAGYYGELETAGATYSTPDPCQPAFGSLGFATSPLTVPAPLQGYQGTALDPAPGCTAAPAPNTAALVLRRLAGTSTALGALSTGTAYLQTSRCATDPTPTPFVLNATAASFTLLDFKCATPMPVRAFESTIYYVASCSVCTGGSPDTIPTLKRVDCTTAGCTTVTALAEGIETLKIEYGFDTNGDGIPDVFLATVDGIGGSKSNDWSNVTAVRLWVVSRTTEASTSYTDTKTYSLGTTFGVVGPYNDGFKRRAYSVLVRLNNPAGWRES